MNIILGISIAGHLFVAVIILIVLLFVISVVTSGSKSIVKNITKILLCVSILAFVIKICFVPNYTTEATVESVGGKGLTVSYVNSYGEKTLTARINVNSVSEYNVGDTITIEVYDFWIK